MWTGGVYTAHRYPSVGDKAYSDNTLTTELGTITATSDSTITVNSQVYSFNGSYNNTPSSETIAGITIQYYLSSDGHKICANDPAISAAEAIYAATGVAWYYILDVTNQRFKLPRTQFGVTGYRDGVGNYVDAGLPNITGTTTAENPGSCSGAFSDSGTRVQGRNGNDGSSASVINFKASDSDSIYGNSTTVQPKATQMYLYFYIGTFTQTALENTAGLNAELFNNKADIDLSNTPISTADYVVEWQNPSAENNYTWYRKYKSGWVEQGCNAGQSGTITLAVEMADANYSVSTRPYGGRDNVGWGEYGSDLNRTTTTFTAGTSMCIWEVKGMAAS